MEQINMNKIRCEHFGIFELPSSGGSARVHLKRSPDRKDTRGICGHPSII